MEDLFDQEEQFVEPTPTPEVKKKVSKKEQPCKDCPDYSKEDLLRDKVLAFRAKGYNDNQIAAMLMVHKQYVESVK
jgi:hypothetical protein